MTGLEIFGGVLLILCCLVIIFFVSLQTEKSDGLASAIMGVDNTSYKGKAKTNEEKMASITKYAGIVFFVLALILNVFVLIANK